MEVSAFGPTLLLGENSRTGEHMVLVLLWWADGRFGTDVGVFRQGVEAAPSNLSLER